MVDLPAPEITDDEVLVKVLFAGVCGTDLHILDNEYSANFPVVLGHEFSGTVARKGKNVTRFDVGDRVVSMTPVSTCGRCEYCQQDLLMLCPERRSIGSGVDGAFAELIKVPEDCVFHVPDNISDVAAALLEPISCCVRAVVECSPVKAGDIVYVSGPGLIGQVVAQLARISGARVVMGGTPKDRDRLEFAKQKGFEVVELSPGFTDEMLKAQFDLPGGFDGVYECSGNQHSAEFCLKAVKKKGFYSQVGLFGRPIPFDMDLALTKEVALTKSYAAERTSWKIAIRLISENKLDLSGFVSKTFELTDWESAIESALSKTEYKTMFRIG